MSATSDTSQNIIVNEVRRFVDKEVIPSASELEHRNEYPKHLMDQVRDMGILGMTISPQYGGLGLPLTTYASVVEELSRGWMSLGGIINTHIIDGYIIENFGTEEQRKRWLPALAEGDKRGALCVTEPNAGSDVQAIETTATRDGDFYKLNGTKMFVSNGRRAHFYMVLCKTNKNASPITAGMSAIFVEKGIDGFRIGRDIDKLGYKGLDTVELDFTDSPVPVTHLVGGREGQGMKHVLSGLEVGRINVASRAVGLARAAFDDAIQYSFQRHSFGKPIFEHQAIHMMLADMATKIEAAHHLVHSAAEKKQRGERSDLETGMAKLFASEVCQEIVVDAMRVFGGYGYTKEMRVERYYRDAPMLIVGEGTSQIQKIVIARALERKYKRK